MKTFSVIVFALLFSAVSAHAGTSFVKLEIIKGKAEDKAQDAQGALTVLKQTEKAKTSLAVRKSMTEVGASFHALDPEVLAAVLSQFTALTGCDFSSDLDNSHLRDYANLLKSRAGDQVIVVKQDEFRLVDGLFGACK